METLDFGKKLIELRKLKGLTQGEVAEKCKVTTRTIQRIESGIVNPRASTIKIISETLGFDFFETSNTGNDVKNESQLLKLKTHNFLWDIKDLFNLKTYTMKKISILTLLALMITLSLYAINTSEELIENNNSITIIYNIDKTLSRIEVRFSNSLTLDSLINIKASLETFDIKINYKKIVFDKSNHLQELYCEVFTKKIGSGSFSGTFLNLEIMGFCCKYSEGEQTGLHIGVPSCFGRKK